MAELSYFGSWDDSVAILTSLFGSEHIRAVIDKGFGSPVPEYFDFPDVSLVDAAHEMPKMYLFGTFSRVGPVFWQQSLGPNAGCFYVDGGKGGPSFDLSLPRETESGLLGYGVFGYRAAYQDPSSGEWTKPTVELKDAFRRLSKIIKRQLVRHRFPKASAWVGRRGLEALRRGTLRVDAKGLV